jgi:hypothetical protein
MTVPMALADPGRIFAVVTPPEMLSLYASSCVLSPSRLQSQGRTGPAKKIRFCVAPVSGTKKLPLCELVSLAPLRVGEL